MTDGVESTVEQAAAAAGDKVVTVAGGAMVNQELLLVDQVGELHIDVMPVFLGDGLRLFANPALERVQIETIGVQAIGARTNLRFRVVKHEM